MIRKNNSREHSASEVTGCCSWMKPVSNRNDLAVYFLAKDQKQKH